MGKKVTKKICRGGSDGATGGQVPFLLAERARSECARLGKERVSARGGGRVRMWRVGKGSLGHSPKMRWREELGGERCFLG